MRVLFAFTLVATLATICLAQANPQAKPEPTPQLSIIQRQIVELPRREPGKFRPHLSLQDALKLAGAYVVKQRINISAYYLYEAKYFLYGTKDNQTPCWFFWWANENGIIGDDVYIVVSIDTRKVWRLPSM